jgi:hypothetical protein
MMDFQKIIRDTHWTDADAFEDKRPILHGMTVELRWPDGTITRDTLHVESKSVHEPSFGSYRHARAFVMRTINGHNVPISILGLEGRYV